MRRKNERFSDDADRVVKDIKRQTRRRFSAEEKIRIVLAGLRGEDSIAELCRQEGIAQSQYYSWSKEFMEAGKKRLAGDTMRAANTDEVKGLRKEARDLKEVVAEQALELRKLKKSMTGDGGDDQRDIHPMRSLRSSGWWSSRICPQNEHWIDWVFHDQHSMPGTISIKLLA